MPSLPRTEVKEATKLKGSPAPMRGCRQTCNEENAHVSRRSCAILPLSPGKSSRFFGGTMMPGVGVIEWGHGEETTRDNDCGEMPEGGTWQAAGARFSPGKPAGAGRRVRGLAARLGGRGERHRYNYAAGVRAETTFSPARRSGWSLDVSPAKLITSSCGGMPGRQAPAGPARPWSAREPGRVVSPLCMYQPW